MHGLINRSIQNFVRDTYGADVWLDIAQAADLDFDLFETMMLYEDSLTLRVMDAACTRLDKDRDTLLEDLGTYLVAHPNTWRIRRLLRFGGADMVGFILSLDDLADRVRLAIPDLRLPTISVTHAPGDGGRFFVQIEGGLPGLVPVAMGCLRAMADDYGALATVELCDATSSHNALSRIEVTLLSTSFSHGNVFDIAGASA